MFHDWRIEFSLKNEVQIKKYAFSDGSFELAQTKWCCLWPPSHTLRGKMNIRLNLVPSACLSVVHLLIVLQLPYVTLLCSPRPSISGFSLHTTAAFDNTQNVSFYQLSLDIIKACVEWSWDISAVREKLKTHTCSLFIWVYLAGTVCDGLVASTFIRWGCFHASLLTMRLSGHYVPLPWFPHVCLKEALGCSTSPVWCIFTSEPPAPTVFIRYSNHS